MQVDPSLKQVGSVGVAKRVNRGLLLNAISLKGVTKGFLDTLA